MKKVYFSIFTTIAIAVIYLFNVSNKVVITNIRGGGGDGIGTEEDAEGRTKYELMMLRDPATGMIPTNIRARELAFGRTLPKDAENIGSSSKTTSPTSTLLWQSRGPWNVGGRTRAMAIDVSSPNVIVAGSCSGGMWRSPDTGNTWVTTTPVNDYQSVSCLAQDTRAGHTNVWYYGSGEADGASASASGAYYSGNGIFKSVDSGKTWSVLPSTAAVVTAFTTWSQFLYTITINPADTINDMVFAAAYGGIYKSINGGSTWSLVFGSFGGPTGDSYFTDVAITHNGVIYIALSSDGGAKGIYRSTDGSTFTNITPDSFPTSYNRIKIGISPKDENQVYFLANTPGFGTPDTNYLGSVEWNSLWKYNYVSGSGTGTGGVWRNFSANIPNTGGVFNKFTCQGSYDMVIKPKPNDTNIVFLGGTCLYRSTSGFADNTHTTYIGGYVPGATLPVVNEYPNHHPDQHELFFYPGNPNIMFSANDGGIFRTNDNTSSTMVWNSLNNGYLSTMFYSCAIDHATTSNIIIGGAQDNGSWYINSASGTSPWLSPYGGDGSYCAIADSGNAYYFSLQQGKMRKLKLNSSGGTDSFARIDPIGGFGYIFVNPFILDPNNNNIMYLAAGTHIWRNNNLAGIPYASNWDTIATNWVQFPDSLTIPNETITALAVSTTPANRLYYGTSSRSLFRMDNANIGTPAPTTLFGPDFPNGYISCIAIDPNNADNVIVVFSNYNVLSLFYSQNGGSTWKSIGGNLEQNNRNGSGNGPSCRWAKIIHVDTNTAYFVGTSIGLFATTALRDTSTIWTQMGTNTIGASVINMIDFRTTDGLMTVATHSHGIFSTNIDSITMINKVLQIKPETNALNFTNYPNPFNSTSNLIFNLEQKSGVTLTIYDISGKIVDILANETMEPGLKNIKWDGINILPGIYFCTLKTSFATTTIKLIHE